MTNPKFDWAYAALSLAQEESNDLQALVDAAGLDPRSGDLSDVDFSGMDLSNQNLSGWDLSEASFENARISGTNFSGANVNPYSIIQAQDWTEGNFDEEFRKLALRAQQENMTLEEIGISRRTANVLRHHNITHAKHLFDISESEFIRLYGIGRRIMNEVKLALSQSELISRTHFRYVPELPGITGRSG
jgi:uncharacterized protein YjbI with pentapeptide repeats